MNLNIKDRLMEKEKVKEEKNIKRKVSDLIKGCPLAVLLVLSTVCLSIYALGDNLLSGRDLHISAKQPMFASLFLDELDEEIVPEEEEDEEEAIYANKGNVVEETTEAPANSNENQIEEETGYPTKFVKKKKVKEKSPYYDDPGKIALTTEYPYIEVGKEYFDDALFIGDSRIDGLKAYSGLDNATFYSKQGISIYKILSEKMVKMKIDGKKKNVTIVKALKKKKFSKIYIMLGINELGYKTTEDFKKQYEYVVNKIAKLQPDAKIFVMGIMRVTNEYSKENEVFNNENINAKNVAIAGIANGINIFYLDFNPEIVDSKNGIKKKYTWDGIHLKAEYYSIWVDYLKKHGM